MTKGVYSFKNDQVVTNLKRYLPQDLLTEKSEVRQINEVEKEKQK